MLTQIENGSPAALHLLDQLFHFGGDAHLVGVTGAPGCGKSCLLNQLALQRLKTDPASWVAILAVDPSSPFTGGALLGDRVRMRDLADDPHIFIRSMAARQQQGGLAAATAGMVRVFEAAGYNLILIETVGSGQNDVDIARMAHTTLVVEAPGMGDEIQAIKAGILEIADLLVINKSDLPGADLVVLALQARLGQGSPVRRNFTQQTASIPEPATKPQTGSLWQTPVLRTSAFSGEGIPELLAAIEAHASHLRASGEWEQRARVRLESEFEHALVAVIHEAMQQGENYQQMLEQLGNRKLSPRQAAKQLMRKSFTQAD